MDITFNDFVNYIRELSTEEKEEIIFIIEKELIEQRRDKIFQNYKSGQLEYESGQMKFSSVINDLKRQLE
jgi:hypothetical protein